MKKRSSYAAWGAGTRAAPNLVLGSKARALLQGRAHVTPADIRALAVPVLRHRILVNYRAEAEGVGRGEHRRETAGEGEVRVMGLNAPNQRGTRTKRSTRLLRWSIIE